MDKINIAGLEIDSITKKEFLDAALLRVKAGQKTFVTTPYSEFLYHSFRDPRLLDVFNKADFALADGIGIFWAKKYLDIPLTAKSYWGKILQAAWQMKYSLAAILFNPRWVKSALPEKIVGADLIWDLAEMAAKNNLSIYLLGGFGETALETAERLNYHINKKCGRTFCYYWSNKNPDNASNISDINQTAPDLLLVAYGPIKQEKWIAENLPKLNAKLTVGVGGSFDYIAGVKSVPPKFIRYSGLEWLWRLITQPYRFKRIINATFGLMFGLLRYKVFTSYPYRQNVVNVVLNKENKILICLRNPNNPEDKKYGFEKKDMLNYWQFCQGGIDKNETIEEAAQRECREELGISGLRVLKISEKHHSYFYPNAKRPLLAKQAKYKGQEQSIIYLQFSGPEDSIKVDRVEFIDYKWVPAERLAEEVHEHRRAVALIIQQDLKEMKEKAIIDR